MQREFPEILKRSLSIAVLSLGAAGVSLSPATAGHTGYDSADRPKHERTMKKEMHDGSGDSHHGGHHGRHHDKHHGKHHGMMMKKMMEAHGKREPTLKIELEGKGREAKFECRASMSECLEAFDKFRDSLRDHRGGRGQDD
jgi:hypothetical protein